MIIRIGFACLAVVTLMGSLAAYAEPRRQGSGNMQNSPHFRMQYPNHRHELADFKNSYDGWQNHRFDWQVGRRLPEQYRYSEYLVDYRENSKLTAPTRFQQWVKIDEQYLLINIMTNTILKIIPE